MRYRSTKWPMFFFSFENNMDNQLFVEVEPKLRLFSNFLLQSRYALNFRQLFRPIPGIISYHSKAKTKNITNKRTKSWPKGQLLQLYFVIL